jgi:hypothetical protein
MTTAALTRPTEQTRVELRDQLENLIHDRTPDQKIADRLTELRPDLTPEERWRCWEEFEDAVDHLADVRSPMFDPTQWDEDRDVMEARWDERAETVITILLGADAGPTEVTR